MTHEEWFAALKPGDRVLLTFDDGSFMAEAVEAVFAKGETTPPFYHAFEAPADLIATSDHFFTADGAEFPVPELEDVDISGTTVGPLTPEMEVINEMVSKLEDLNWCHVPEDKLRAIVALVG